MIAVQILTTNNSKTLNSSIYSFINHSADFKIYLIYQGKNNHPKLIEDIIDKGHCVFMESHSKVTALRNFYMNYIKEDIMVRADDDIIINEGYNINRIINFLKNNKKSFVSSMEVQIGNGKGVMSENYSDGQGFIYMLKNIVVKKFICPKKLINHDNEFVELDFTRNLLVSLTANFKNVKWNENIFFEEEHIAFMLSAKMNNYNIYCHTPSVHYHFDSLKLIEGNDKRKRELDRGRNILRKDYGVFAMFNIRCFRTFVNKIASMLMVKI